MQQGPSTTHRTSRPLELDRSQRRRFRALNQNTSYHAGESAVTSRRSPPARVQGGPPSKDKNPRRLAGEAVDKEGSTAFFVEFGIKQFRREVFICSGRTHPGNFNPKQS